MKKDSLRIIVKSVLIVLVLICTSGCGVAIMNHNQEVLNRTAKGTSKAELLPQLKEQLIGQSECDSIGIVNNKVIEKCWYNLGTDTVNWAPLYVFFYDAKYVAWGNSSGVLSLLADDINLLNQRESLILLFRKPTEEKRLDQLPAGISKLLDVYANDEFIGKLAHVDGLLWSYEGEKDIKLTIMEDGKVMNSVNFKVSSGETYKLEYHYSSGVIAMLGDKDSVIKVTSTPSGASIYTGPDNASLEDTGFTTPHSFPRMSGAFKWMPECYQLKLNNQESEVICKDNTFGDREVHFDFNTGLQSNPQELVKTELPVEYEPDARAEEKLTHLKKMFDKGLITQEEYKIERAEVLEKF